MNDEGEEYGRASTSPLSLPSSTNPSLQHSNSQANNSLVLDVIQNGIALDPFQLPKYPSVPSESSPSTPRKHLSPSFHSSLHFFPSYHVSPSRTRCPHPYPLPSSPFSSDRLVFRDRRNSR
jgi:hypothetical protein